MSPATYKRERKARGLTQAGLAALLDVQRETIVRREAGEVEITREMELALLSLPKPSPASSGKPNDAVSQPGQPLPKSSNYSAHP